MLEVEQQGEHSLQSTTLRMCIPNTMKASASSRADVGSFVSDDSAAYE